MTRILDMPYASGQISSMLGYVTKARAWPRASASGGLAVFSTTLALSESTENCARTTRSRSSHPCTALWRPWNVKWHRLPTGLLLLDPPCRDDDDDDFGDVYASAAASLRGNVAERPSKSHSLGFVFFGCSASSAPRRREGGGKRVLWECFVN